MGRMIELSDDFWNLNNGCSKLLVDVDHISIIQINNSAYGRDDNGVIILTDDEQSIHLKIMDKDIYSKAQKKDSCEMILNKILSLKN